MKICIINGSPRRGGNTEEVLKPFRRRLTELGAQVDDVFLADYKIEPCVECYTCQDVQGEYGCVQKDDAEEIWRRAGEADVLVLAAPIFSWYCPSHMKALLDRHYALNNYKADYANEPFETGIRRLCKHCHWDYAGLYSVRDVDGMPNMQTPEAIAGAERFAEELFEKMNVSRETL